MKVVREAYTNEDFEDINKMKRMEKEIKDLKEERKMMKEEMDKMREKMEKIENNQNKGKENKMQMVNEEKKEKRARPGSPAPRPSKRTKEPDRIARIDDRVEMENEGEIRWEYVNARGEKKYEGKNKTVNREGAEDNRKGYNDRQNEERYRYRGRNRIERDRELTRNGNDTHGTNENRFRGRDVWKVAKGTTYRGTCEKRGNRECGKNTEKNHHRRV